MAWTEFFIKKLGTLSTKNPPIDADKVIYRDSTASDGLVTSTWAQVWTYLKGKSDILYSALAHKTSHITGGSDIIDNATTTTTGLMSTTDKTKLDGIEASAVALATVKADSDVASAISLKHAKQHAITSTADHDPTGLTALQLLRINTGGTAIESSGKVVGDFAVAGAAPTAHKASHTTGADILDVATTAAVGVTPIATAPAAGLLNVLGIANGETVRTDKALFDATHPEDVGITAAEGSQIIAARRDHVHSIAANAVTLAKLATQAANTVLANQTVGAAVPTAVAMAASTILARLAAGNIVAATTAEMKTLLAYLQANDALGTPASGTLTNCTGLPTGGMLDESVTYAKMQHVEAESVVANNTAATADPKGIALAEQTVLGRITGGHVVGLTVAQINALLSLPANMVYTRSMTAGSGDVAYTGVGFTPTHIEFIAIIALYSCQGVSDSSRVVNVMQNSNATFIGSANAIHIGTGATYQAAIVKTYDADGFTLTWTKGGTPAAGTMQIFAKCYR